MVPLGRRGLGGVMSPSVASGDRNGWMYEPRPVVGGVVNNSATGSPGACTRARIIGSPCAPHHLVASVCAAASTGHLLPRSGEKTGGRRIPALVPHSRGGVKWRVDRCSSIRTLPAIPMPSALVAQDRVCVLARDSLGALARSAETIGACLTPGRRSELALMPG